jgi:hypothetical protein
MNSTHRLHFEPRLRGTMKLVKVSRPAVLMFAGILGQLSGSAQTPLRQKIDVSKLGPQVGERVPDFSLKDQNGTRQTLQSIMGPKGAMLVFVRSSATTPFRFWQASVNSTILAIRCSPMSAL